MTKIFKLLLDMNIRIDEINSEFIKELNKIKENNDLNTKNSNKIIEMLINLKQHPFRKN
jgi:hypothetical protein